MPLTVSQITDPSDFNELMSMEYDAWRVPYNPQLKHFRPDMLDRTDSIARAIAKNEKALQEHKSNEFMIKVTDTETNEIIGFAFWELNEMKVQGDGKMEASWYPEGSEEKEFAELFMDGLSGFMNERVTRKHMGNLNQCLLRWNCAHCSPDLHSITVHTSHRHRGAGRMLIRWGTGKADEFGVETVISSLPSARGAYEKSGFGCIEVIPPNPSLETRLEELEREGKGKKWRELLEDDLSGFLMWRPIGRDWAEGDKAPWM
jgi:GNAT superfamily N-acetyltransferase